MNVVAPEIAVPIDPTALARLELESSQRGRLYNELGLSVPERSAVETALRMVEAGDYPASSRAAAMEHLRHERATRENLGRPGRRRQ